MPPIISDSVTLQCPRSDGSGAALEVYTLAQFDDQRLPVTAALTIAINTQPSVISALVGTFDVPSQTFTADPTGKSVKVQTIAPKPSNLTGSLVRVRDGRQNPDGSPVEFVVNITYVTPPSVPPTIELVSKQPVVTLP